MVVVFPMLTMSKKINKNKDPKTAIYICISLKQHHLLKHVLFHRDFIIVFKIE